MVDLQKESKAWESRVICCSLGSGKKENRLGIQFLNWRERTHRRVVEGTYLVIGRCYWMEIVVSKPEEGMVETVVRNIHCKQDY